MRPGDLIQPGEPGVEEPRVRVFPPYSYPAAARGSGRRATVRVEVLVDERGRVIETRLADASRSGLGFEEAAQAAARKAKFLPPTRDAIPGRMWTELRFAFGE
jgi:TonB family protein